MDGDPYPNDGTFFQPETPEVTKQTLKDEEKRAYEAQPFIQDLITWFDTCIAATNELSTVRQDANRRKIPIEVAVEAYDLTRELLEQKRGELVSLAETLK